MPEQKGRGGRTRDRILEAARILMNEEGIAQVTTAAIAGASTINEGNLYYHYRKKSDLMAALYRRFSCRMLAILDDIEKADLSPDDLPQFLSDWLQLTWDYRFFFRDKSEITALAPELVPETLDFSARGLERMHGVIESLKGAGLLAASDADSRYLARTSWLVGTYWFHYLQNIEGRGEIGPDCLWEGIQYILRLYDPFATEAGQRFLEQARKPRPPVHGAVPGNQYS